MRRHAGGTKGFDRVCVLGRQVDVVPAIDEFLLPHRIKIKGDPCAADHGDTCCQVNAGALGVMSQLTDQLLDFTLGKLRWQEAVVHRIAAENITKTWGEHRPNAKIDKRIDCRLPA